MATGLDYYTYYNSATYASPTWVLAANVDDFKHGGDTNEVSGGSRASRWDQMERGLKKYGASFKYVKKSNDATAYEKFRDVWLNDTNLEIAIADGPIATTGTKYLRATCGVFKWEESQDLEAKVAADVEMKLIDGVTHPPAYTTV